MQALQNKWVYKTVNNGHNKMHNKQNKKHQHVTVLGALHVHLLMQK